MSGIRPLFISAPRINIRLNERSIAYAIGLNCNVSVDVQPVYTVGEFKASSLEPVQYNLVTGTLQIIRLQRQSQIPNKIDAAKAANDASKMVDVNTLTQIQDTTLNTADSNTILGQQALHLHLNPDLVLFSETFDLDIYLKVTGNLKDPTDAGFNIAQNSQVETWFRIQDCRISSRNTNIAQGQLVNEPLNFQGLLAVNLALAEALREKLDTIVADGVVS